METLRAGMGADVCPHRIPSRGSIPGPGKFQGSRPPQVLQIAGPRGHMGGEAAGNGGEGLGGLLDAAVSGRKKPWWTPIFKFPGDRGPESNDAKAPAAAESGEIVPPRRERRATVFTDEKARLLRRELRATESWHDLMYHSAIASRLAFPDDD